MTEDCLFCSIAAGDIAADVVFSNDDVVAFTDLSPQAPTHVLVIPRTHVRDIVELSADQGLAGRFLVGLHATARALGIDDFRTVFNTGAQAHQTVFHVHAHLLSGRSFGWPPG